MAKMSDAISKNKKKTHKKRQWREIRFTLFKIFVAYPIGYPIMKVQEKHESMRNEFWSNRLPKLREKSMNEALQVIQKDMGMHESVFVYKANRNDYINYVNAFYLKAFVGYGAFTYKKKTHPKSSYYYDLVVKNVDKGTHLTSYIEEFYDTYFLELKERVRNEYDDVKITEGKDSGYAGGHEYFKIKVCS